MRNQRKRKTLSLQKDMEGKQRVCWVYLFVWGPKICSPRDDTTAAAIIMPEAPEAEHGDLHSYLLTGHRLGSCMETAPGSTLPCGSPSSV